MSDLHDDANEDDGPKKKFRGLSDIKVYNNYKLPNEYDK